MALGRIYLFGPAPSEALNSSTFLAAGVVLAILLGYRSTLPSWLLTDAFLVPLYGLIIYAGSRLEGTLHGVFAHPVLVLLGHASYSIYILHIGILFWWQWIAHKVFHLRFSPTIELVIILSLVIAASVCVFLYFERPLRRWIVQSTHRLGRVPTVQM
jgi:peptidoglycan/LPS O-acetylase OafA/YrhL